MRNRILVILFLFATIYLFGTEQAPDIIFFDGTLYYIDMNHDESPLESYFTGVNIRPFFSLAPEGLQSTGNGRGYVASWIIIQDKLYLLAIDSWLEDKKVSLNDFFQIPEREMVFAEWYSGTIHLKLQQYIYREINNIFNIRIENGNVVSINEE